MTVTRINPRVTAGRANFTVSMDTSWHSHYFNTVSLSFADQGTTDYSLVVTLEDGGAIGTCTVKSKRTNGADVFVMYPVSWSSRTFTLNYIVAR